MPRVDIPELGAIGIVRDMPYHEMPPNAWSSGKNVRMDKNEVVSFLGNNLATSSPDVLTIQNLAGVSTDVAHYWFYMGSTGAGAPDIKAYAFDGATHNDITPAAGAIAGTEDDIIVGTLLNQNIVITNSIDQPFGWDLVPGSPMTLIPGWNALWATKGIHAHKGFLISYNNVESGVSYPYRVRWSDAAPPGALPNDWDDADPTNQAGFVDLGDATSAVVFAQHLRDTVYLYTNNQTFGMQWIGGQFIWRFYTVSLESGILTQRCATNVRDNIQVVVSDGDILKVDGQNVVSIVNRKNRSWMFSQLNPLEFHKTFCFTHIPENEVWVCFPSGQSEYPDLALVWNYLSDTWYQRELPVGALGSNPALDIGPGNVVPTWASSTGFTWANPPTPRWNDPSYRISEDVLIMGAGADIHRMDKGNQFAGVDKVSSIERLGLRLAGDRVNMVTRVWPRMTGTAPVNISVGGQMAPGGPVLYRGPYSFDPNKDSFISCRVLGRTHSIKYETAGNSEWRLQGHELEYQQRGFY